jgi:dTDP-4-dehydrorhamnose 3,5-epimerase
MIFTPLKLDGIIKVELELHEDERGGFARCYCKKEFQNAGLPTNWLQMNISSNLQSGTLRGLHYQTPPASEAKLVRCSKGAIWDVAVDLRKDSQSFGKWLAIELSDSNHHALYIPAGFAHGFQTLHDDTNLLYMHSELYNPGYEGGINPLDAQLAIPWPLPVTRISERDRELPNLTNTKPLENLQQKIG